MSKDDEQTVYRATTEKGDPEVSEIIYYFRFRIQKKSYEESSVLHV